MLHKSVFVDFYGGKIVKEDYFTSEQYDNIFKNVLTINDEKWCVINSQRAMDALGLEYFRIFVSRVIPMKDSCLVAPEVKRLKTSPDGQSQVYLRDDSTTWLRTRTDNKWSQWVECV